MKPLCITVDLEKLISNDVEIQFPKTGESLPFSDFMTFRNEFSDLMQFIGFDDIYEGDIVKGYLTLENDDNYDFIGQVVYKAPSFMCAECDFPLECYDRFEILGNIYESQER